MKNYAKIKIIVAICITSLFFSSITISGHYNNFFEIYAQNNTSNNATSNTKPLPVL